MMDAAKLESKARPVSSPLFRFPRARFLRPARSTFPTFPHFLARGIRLSACNSGKSVCARQLLRPFRSGRKIPRRPGIWSGRLRQAVNGQDRDDVDAKFGEGPSRRERLLEVVKLVFQNRPGAGRQRAGPARIRAFNPPDIVLYRYLSDTLGFIQYSVSSLA